MCSTRGGRQPISTKPQIVSAKPAQCQNVMHHYACGPREPCRFRKLAEHTAQQVEHRERMTECQYLARLMRALAPNRNSNSSSMIPLHKTCAGRADTLIGAYGNRDGFKTGWTTKTVRLTPGRASGGSPKFHGRVRVRQSVSFRDSTGDPGRVWSVDQADLSAGGGGTTLWRIPLQHRDLVDHGRAPGVLQHV